MGLLLEALHSVDFLAAANDGEVTRFMVLGKSADYPKSHVFWRAGKPPECLVIPVSGEAKTTTRNPEGREFIEGFVGSGDCIGLASALDGLEHPTGAEVVRTGEFFTISRANFLKVLDENPDIRSRAVAMIGALYRRNLKEREDAALRPVPERLAGFLLGHACVRQADGTRVLMHVTQAELAARLGTVREVVSRILTDLGQRGLIDRSENGVFVSDWNGLRAEAGLGFADDADAALRESVRSTAQQLTARFFLPTAERMRRDGDADEAAKCQAHLGDLALCRERGCPGALEASKRRRST